MAIIAAIVAPLARRITFGSGAFITWETDNGAISNDRWTKSLRDSFCFDRPLL
jgi:hypothetical protein